MIRKVYYTLVHALLKRLHGKSFCMVYNLVQAIGRRDRRCSPVPTDGLIHIVESTAEIYVSRPGRYRYYSDGIDFRLHNLFQQYCGSLVSIRAGDVIIDCGANVGEFSMFCQKHGAVCIAFEPDPLEFKALQRNVDRLDLIQQAALWKDNTTLSFNLANDTGDSSFDAGFQDGNKVLVQACRLDSIAFLKSLDVIKLLKLEAEGFELEVLMGAESIIDRIEYIAADLGPERGPEMQSPLPCVTNLLFSRGFKVINYNPSRSILLFRNERLVAMT